MYRKVKV